MKKCEKYQAWILAGEDANELRSHLAQCPECAAAKSAWEAMKSASVPPEVPELLSVNVKNYAAAALQKKKQKSFRLKYIWTPAAAAVFLCFGIVYSSAGLNQTGPVKRAPQVISESYGSMDNLDSDLIALTAQLEQTSDSLLSVTLLSSIIDTAQK